MKFRDIRRRLRADGWYRTRCEGSHEQWSHPTKSGTVTVAGHDRGEGRAEDVAVDRTAGRMEVTMRYAVIYETTSTGFSAYVPDLPGVAVAGKSRDETREMLRKAVAWHLEAIVASGQSIPQPITGAEELELGPEAA
jgi:predicted RNase H-like HicB family nuclease